jgi:hypothetical protein
MQSFKYFRDSYENKSKINFYFPIIALPATISINIFLPIFFDFYLRFGQMESFSENALNSFVSIILSYPYYTFIFLLCMISFLIQDAKDSKIINLAIIVLVILPYIFTSFQMIFGQQ